MPVADGIAGLSLSCAILTARHVLLIPPSLLPMQLAFASAWSDTFKVRRSAVAT